MAEEQQPLYSSIDPDDWRAECSRVAHRLVDLSPSSFMMSAIGNQDKGKGHNNAQKINLSRIERAMLESDLLSKQVEHLRRRLEMVRVDAIHGLDQIASCNRYVERHYGHITKEIEKIRIEFKKVSKESDDMDEDIVMKTKQLNTLQKEVKLIKQELYDWSQKITDNAPLVELKSIHEQMKEELKAMNVQGGLLWLEFLKTELVPDEARAEVV